MAAAGRTILFSSHILEEVERLADSVLVIYAGRLAASGDFRSIRRLMTDRPHTFTVRSSDDRRLAAAAAGGHAPSSAPSWATDRLSVRTSDFDGFGRALPRLARDGGHLAVRGHAHRRVARERLQLPGAPVIARHAAHRGHAARRAGPPTDVADDPAGRRCRWSWRSHPGRRRPRRTRRPSSTRCSSARSCRCWRWSSAPRPWAPSWRTARPST